MERSGFMFQVLGPMLGYIAGMSTLPGARQIGPANELEEKRVIPGSHVVMY